jgi:hypothetical protein
LPARVIDHPLFCGKFLSLGSLLPVFWPKFTYEQARLSLFEYLELYYNRQRRHSTLGYVNPLIYEQLGAQQVEANA